MVLKIMVAVASSAAILQSNNCDDEVKMAARQTETKAGCAYVCIYDNPARWSSIPRPQRRRGGRSEADCGQLRNGHGEMRVRLYV